MYPNTAVSHNRYLGDASVSSVEDRTFMSVYLSQLMDGVSSVEYVGRRMRMPVMDANTQNLRQMAWKRR